MLPGPSELERYEPVLESEVDEDLDPNPCEENEEYFKSRPNAEEMEQAISKFLDGMPALESNGYQQLQVHSHLAKLPVPDKQKISSMTQAQEFSLPHGICRHSSFRWQAWQQCV